jgi:hypothetical protein
MSVVRFAAGSIAFTLACSPPANPVKPIVESSDVSKRTARSTDMLSLSLEASADNESSFVQPDQLVLIEDAPSPVWLAMRLQFADGAILKASESLRAQALEINERPTSAFLHATTDQTYGAILAIPRNNEAEPSQTPISVTLGLRFASGRKLDVGLTGQLIASVAHKGFFFDCHSHWSVSGSGYSTSCHGTGNCSTPGHCRCMDPNGNMQTSCRGWAPCFCAD